MTETVTTERFGWLKWIDGVSIVAAAVGGIATFAMMLNVVADVTVRAISNRPLPGTLELAQFVWMPTAVALGLGFALLRGEHIRVNLLSAPAGPRTQRIVEVVGMVFTLATVGALIWFGVERALDSFGETAPGSRWIPVWPIRWVVALGLAVLFLQTLATLVRAISVDVFVPGDADEVQTELEAERTVFDDFEATDEASLAGKEDRR